MVAYQRFKTIENSKTVSRKSGLGRLLEVVVYERFQYRASTENMFGVLGGGRTWRYFDYFPVRCDGHTSGHHARHFTLESNQIVDVRVPASSDFSSSSIVVTYIPAKTLGKHHFNYNNLRHDLLQTSAVTCGFFFTRLSALRSTFSK